MYRAVILGGSGFIGRALAVSLRDMGLSVIAIARHWEEKILGVECFSGNAYDAELIRNIVQPGDLVYHLASATIPSTSNNDFLYDCEQNLINSLHLLEVLKELRIARFVYASSGGTVYGIPASVPICESAATFPISAYGVSKLAVEKYLYLYSRLHGIPVCILRIANPYGPGQEKQKGQGVIGTFIRNGLAGDNIEIWGDGSIVRDYIYIDDLVEVLIKAARVADKFLLLNVGGGRGYSLLDIIKCINEAMLVDLNVIYKDQRDCDVPAVVLDISKVRSRLNWSPKTSLEQGIRKTVTALKCR